MKKRKKKKKKKEEEETLTKTPFFHFLLDVEKMLCWAGEAMGRTFWLELNQVLFLFLFYLGV